MGDFLDDDEIDALLSIVDDDEGCYMIIEDEIKATFENLLSVSTNLIITKVFQNDIIDDVYLDNYLKITYRVYPKNNESENMEIVYFYVSQRLILKIFYFMLGGIVEFPKSLNHDTIDAGVELFNTMLGSIVTALNSRQELLFDLIDYKAVNLNELKTELDKTFNVKLDNVYEGNFVSNIYKISDLILREKFDAKKDDIKNNKINDIEINDVKTKSGKIDPINFCYWLQGFFELTNQKTLTEKQFLIIKDHLQLVFNKVTPDRDDDKIDDRIEECGLCNEIPAPSWNHELDCFCST